MLTLKGGQRILACMDDGVAHAIVLENFTRVGELDIPQKDFPSFCSAVKEEVKRQGHEVAIQVHCPNVYQVV